MPTRPTLERTERACEWLEYLLACCAQGLRLTLKAQRLRLSGYLIPQPP